MRRTAWRPNNKYNQQSAARSGSGLQNKAHPGTNDACNQYIVPVSYQRIIGGVFSPPQDSANCIAIASFSGRNIFPFIERFTRPASLT